MKICRSLTACLIIVCLAASSATNTAYSQEEARAAWQVVRYDITVNVPAAAVAPAERALTVRAALTVRNIGQSAGRTLTLRINPAAEVKAVNVAQASATFRSRTDDRTKLQQVAITLPAAVAAKADLSVTIDYRLPVTENSGLAALSQVGVQFLPLSAWYPTPNTPFAVRGADTAPFRLTVNSPGHPTVISSGRSTNGGSSGGGGAAFEQNLSAQPFFVAGKWDAIEGAAEARGMSAWLYMGATAEERQQATALLGLAANARSFYAGLLGAAPDAPVKIVAVARGAGFNDAGTLLLDHAVFRRPKVDAATALLVAEATARLWIGGATAVRGEGSGVVREGLTRYLATLFIEKQFGREAADAERMRIATAYAAVARRASPLTQSTPLFETHYTVVANKGALVWRLADRALDAGAFASVLRAQLEAGREGGVTLAGLRAALAERGGANVRALLDYGFDQPTDTDLLVGLPHQQGGEWISTLRNLGSLAATVTVAATTDQGERLTQQASVPAKDFGEVRFRTAARVVSAEVDPEKIYPQLDYTNDIAPRPPLTDEAYVEATRLFARSEYAGAERIAREAVRSGPRKDEARVVLARALLAQNKSDEAEREFRGALDERLPLATTLAWANVGLGDIALRKGQAAEAAKRFDEAARVDAEYAATLAARANRLKAEAAVGSAPAPDEAVRSFIKQLDAAIRSGRKAEIDALVVAGELNDFSRGIVGNQPEMWQTRVLRTESLGADRVAADVAITAKTLGRDQAGTAVLVLARAGSGWKLADIQLFEVR